MKPLIETPPRTIMEVYKSLPEGTLAEVIDNQIYMSPSPAYLHQEVLIEIASQLRVNLKKSGAKVIIAPFDVYLDESSNAVQPDIVVILRDNNGKLNYNGHFHGTPDVLIEILSPNNKDHDLIRKKELYERFAVKEYWIVDPENRVATVFELANNRYQRAAENIGMLESKLLGTSILF